MNGFCGALRPIPTKNCFNIFKKACWKPGLTLVDNVEYLKLLCSSIIVQKLTKNVKTTGKFSFCIIWVFLRKLSGTKAVKFSFKRAVDPVLLSRAIGSFYLTFFQSQQNSLKLSEISKTLTFGFFCGQVWASVQPKSANNSLRADWNKRLIFVERLPSF